ncbi:LanC-like protein 2 [Irineochytrium annulatum]|nr:LanC-like protein 2 [Irineochytrium annulatum]
MSTLEGNPQAASLASTTTAERLDDMNDMVGSMQEARQLNQSDPTATNNPTSAPMVEPARAASTDPLAAPAPATAAAEIEESRPNSRHIPNPYLQPFPPEPVLSPADIHANARGKLVEIARLVRDRHDPLDHAAPYDVYHGHAGLALLFFRIHASDPAFVVDHAGGTGKVSALALAREYIQSALTKVAAAAGEQRGRSHVGFMGSPAGVYAIAAVVLSHCGSNEESDRALDHLVAMKGHCFSHSTSSELLYGRSGYLYSLLFVRHHLSTKKTRAGAAFIVTDALIEQIYHAIVEDGRMGAKRTFLERQGREASSTRLSVTIPLLWSWHLERYLGAAHGVAGVLGVLMSVPWMMDGRSKEERKAEVGRMRTRLVERLRRERAERMGGQVKSEAGDVKMADVQAEGGDVAMPDVKPEGEDTNMTDVKTEGGVPPTMAPVKSEEEDDIARRVRNMDDDAVLTAIVDPEERDKLKRTKEIISTLGQLRKRMLRNGNFPVRIDENLSTSPQLYDAEELVQFCHGSPGIIFCLLRGYEAFKDEALLDCAKKSSDSVWQRGALKKGVGLCHGISGNALVFLSLYKHTRDPLDLYKADRFLQLCCDHEKHCPPPKCPQPALSLDPEKRIQERHRPRSGIMEGLGGVAWLACEVGYWESEKEGGPGVFGYGGFPCFTAY